VEFPNLHPNEKGHQPSEIQFDCVSADSDSLDRVSKSNFKEFSALCHEFGFEIEIESSSYRLSKVETTIEELKTENSKLKTENRNRTPFR
jgi:hypothetical protein